MTNPFVVPTFGRWARRPALLALLALAACTSTDVVGTWVGKDHGVDVVYSFKPDGTGFRSVDGEQVALTYELRRGYPNRILISVGGPPASQVSQGLLQISWDDRMQLELGSPGGPAPDQLTDSALTLVKPPSR